MPLRACLGKLTGDHRCPFHRTPAGKAAEPGRPFSPSAQALPAAGATIVLRALSARATIRQCALPAVLAPATWLAATWLAAARLTATGLAAAPVAATRQSPAMVTAVTVTGSARGCLLW